MMSNNSDTINNYDRFYNYLGELLQNYTKLNELLAKKLAAIAAFNTVALDGIIKEEQVFVLLSRGFDSNIQSYREKLSLKGDSLSAVITEMPEEQQPRFQSMFQNLKARLDEVKDINEKCQSLIEDRIYSLERAIRQIDKSGNATYGKPGAAKPAASPDSRIFKKSI